MFDKENKNCSFAEQAVALLYGEIETENRAALETHLQTCASCADEMEGFGAVRASIGDWRAMEFDSLATPAIEFEPQRQVQNIAAVSPLNESWLDGLRKIFSPAPAFAFAAALLLATVCAGLIAYNLGGGNQIADKQNREGATQTNISTPVKNTNQTSDVASGVNKQSAKENLVESKTVNDKTASPQNNDGRRIVKISNDAHVIANRESVAPKTFKPAANRKAFDSNQTVAQNVSPAKRRSAPKLSNIEDEDDEAALRLSDLLDDAGGK